MTRRADAVTVLLVLGLLLGAVAMEVGGYGLFVVTGASMEPAIAQGSLVLARPVLPAALAVGDVVTYQHAGRTVTHRIGRIEELGDKRAFAMKGDANEVADPEPVAFDHQAGLLVAHVPLAGHALGLVQAHGRALSLALALVFALGLIAGYRPRPFPLATRA